MPIMPIATGVMLLTNVGLAIFNNWRGTNNNKELQQKQREFQKAAQERNNDRMRRLLREGQELNTQIESELHKNRIDSIERDFDNLINRIFAADAINAWPLKVLPMVMKNESLGSMFSHYSDCVALHCILAPSNNTNFNKSVFPQVEREVEMFCNNYYTSLSDHPLIFYSGAWKSRMYPTGNEIEQMVADLPNLPMLVISPFFKPDDSGLSFHINIWGMCERQFIEISPTIAFDYDYTGDLKYTDDVIVNSVEQISPYLESLIGYFADVYFWSSYNKIPITPLMIKEKVINTDGMANLFEENTNRYMSLIRDLDVRFPKQFVSLYSGLSPLLQNKNDKLLESYLLSLCKSRTSIGSELLSDYLKQPIFLSSDEDLLRICKDHSEEEHVKVLFDYALNNITHNDEYRCAIKDLLVSDLKEESCEQFDLVDVLNRFNRYCLDYGIQGHSLLIEQKNFREFIYNEYDDLDGQIVFSHPGFNYICHPSRLRYSPRVKGLFNDGALRFIYCKHSDIAQLINRIQQPYIL